MRISRINTLSSKSRVLHLSKYGSRISSSWTEKILEPQNRVQVYVSRCLDPCVNLALEKYIFQTSKPDTFILLFYINRPSVIIGRNQNPWLEVNLGLIRRGKSLQNASSSTLVNQRPIELVRRISGGGTVFHDEGNVNWTVICPPASFTRDKHAVMITRALQKLGKGRVQVNERHDIILREGTSSQTGLAVDTPFNQAPAFETNSQMTKAKKISGSAYKLTRLRALHHGTCLLSSPNLEYISDYLNSPAKPFIQARGVESVSSPVANVGVSSEDFIDATSKEFYKLHRGDEEFRSLYEIQAVNKEGRPTNEISRNYEELRSTTWTYGQTPQFTFSMGGDEKVSSSQWPFPSSDVANIAFSFKARSGIITESDVLKNDPLESRHYPYKKQDNPLSGLNLFSITNWDLVLDRLEVKLKNRRMSDWIKQIFPEKHMLP